MTTKKKKLYPELNKPLDQSITQKEGLVLNEAFLYRNADRDLDPISVRLIIADIDDVGEYSRRGHFCPCTRTFYHQGAIFVPLCGIGDDVVTS